MPIWMKSIFSVLVKILLSQRGAVGEEGSAEETGEELGDLDGEGQGEETAGEAGAETEGDSAEGATGAQAQESRQAGRDDWKIKKYGKDWETNLDYWKDTAGYWHGEHGKEKTKRQSLQKQSGGIKAAETTVKPTGKDDDVPPWLNSVQDIGEFYKNLKREIQTDSSNREIKANITRSDEAARGQFNDYDEVIEEYVKPLVFQQPKIWEIIRQMENPGMSAYYLGLVLKQQQGGESNQDRAEQRGREQLADKINSATKSAALNRARKGSTATGALTAAQIAGMSDEDMDKEIEKIKGTAA